jgi:putative acetyltransferase
MLVRPEEFRDIPAIFAVHSASFPTDLEARLVDALRAAGRLSVSVVADADDVVAGHVAFSPVMAANGAIGAGLGPIAVLDSHRRKGVAAQLVKTGLAQCRAAGFGWAVVLGDPAYYSRFGFRPASLFGLSDEFQGGPAFQALELVLGELPVGSGLVRYSSEFTNALDSDEPRSGEIT